MHQPVLLQEVLTTLDPKEGETFVDATINRGGHALPLAERLGSTGCLVGIDQDETALAEAKINLADVPCQLILVQANFRRIKTVLAEAGKPQVEGILFDLGFSSNQLDAGGRGLSFLRDEPLAMNLGTGKEQPDFSARDIVNGWSAEDISNVLIAYGEEQFAERIAERIVAERERQPIERTTELVEIINRAVPAWYRHRKIHPATKTFQALRIAVNDELGAIKEALAGAWDSLTIGGRLGVITFHSLEAKIVKEFFLNKKKSDQGELVTKHAVKPTRTEMLSNSRSRSAQWRVIKKIK